MSRFKETATLVAVAVTVGEEGQPVETLTETPTYCNVYRVGETAWLAAMSAGLHADAQIEVRTCEYSGQQRVSMRGVIYDVERASERGEFTRLTLARRLDG